MTDHDYKQYLPINPPPNIFKDGWRTIIVCSNPENCNEHHCERPLGMENDGVEHHYGCECEECIEYYRSLK